MKEILPAFDAMPDVIPRYAWFVARGAENANDVLITGDDLNELGRYYNGGTTAPASDDERVAAWVWAHTNVWK